MSLSPAPIIDLEAAFGTRPGTDRFLIPRDALERWLFDAAAHSDRLRIETIGTSTEGNEMLLAMLSSPDTLGGIEDMRASRQRLSEPALLRDPGLRDGMSAASKPVVLITAGIHATEVGGVQLIPDLVAELMDASKPRSRRLLEKLAILIVPTLNPDGMDLVHDWYMKTLGTPAEGSDPPALYHRYAGHDNNRDWYTHALTETRNVVDKVLRPWRPHVVLDLHQMSTKSPRYVVPPYLDPPEPHVHRLINSRTSSLGSQIATAHHRAGHEGVASGVLFDCYSPSRVFPHYHGGVRILAEAASARIASPVSIDDSELEVRRGFDPRIPSLHNPIPWPGGEWRLRGIMDYHLTSVFALLEAVAAEADAWIADQRSMLADEVRNDRDTPYAISPLRFQRDPRAARDLVEILQRGDVELDYVETKDGDLPAGTMVVRPNQPFGGYARALLDITPYPDMPLAPYDVTSHCLPVHMGVEVSQVDAISDLAARPLAPADMDVFASPGASAADRSSWLAIDHRSHASIRVVMHALRNGADVRRLVRPHFDAGRLLDPGTWLIAGDHALDGMSLARRETIRTWLVRPVPRGTVTVAMPRLGVHVPYSSEAVDVGWLRLMLETSGIPYSVLTDEDIRNDNIGDVDTIAFGHQTPEDLLNGVQEQGYAEPYAGGVGTSGLLNLNRFLEVGGHVIAIDGALRALAAPLRLPIRFPLTSMTNDLFASPGAVIKVEPNTADPLRIGIDEPFPAMFDSKNAFASRSPRAHPSFAAHFAAEPLLSGWMRNGTMLSGLGAIGHFPVGAGSVTGFAFKPHFRTQMLASYLPLINAIMRTSREDHGDRVTR